MKNSSYLFVVPSSFILSVPGNEFRYGASVFFTRLKHKFQIFKKLVVNFFDLFLCTEWLQRKKSAVGLF